MRNIRLSAAIGIASTIPFAIALHPNVHAHYTGAAAVSIGVLFVAAAVVGSSFKPKWALVLLLVGLFLEPHIQKL